jgi:hypothetical protein
MFLDEYSMAAYYVGQKGLAKVNMEGLFNSSIYETISDNEKERLQKNYSFYNS